MGFHRQSQAVDYLPKRVTDRWARYQIALALDARPFGARLARYGDDKPISNLELRHFWVLLHNRPRAGKASTSDAAAEREWELALKEAGRANNPDPPCDRCIFFGYGSMQRDPLLRVSQLATYAPDIQMRLRPAKGEAGTPSGIRKRPRPANLGLAGSPGTHPPGCIRSWLSSVAPSRYNESRGGRPTQVEVMGAITGLIRLVAASRPQVGVEDVISPETCVALLLWLDVLFGESLPPPTGFSELKWAGALGLPPVEEIELGVASSKWIRKLARKVGDLTRPPGTHKGASWWQRRPRPKALRRT